MGHQQNIWEESKWGSSFESVAAERGLKPDQGLVATNIHKWSCLDKRIHCVVVWLHLWGTTACTGRWVFYLVWFCLGGNCKGRDGGWGGKWDWDAWCAIHKETIKKLKNSKWGIVGNKSVETMDRGVLEVATRQIPTSLHLKTGGLYY